jgi:hypothetical protein
VVTPWESPDVVRGYVSVKWGETRYLGVPKSGLRHVARVILSLLAGTDPDAADWALSVRNGAFHQNLALFRRGGLRAG